MKQILIGMTARSQTQNDNRTFYDNESYFEYIRQAGGIPVLLGTVGEEEAEVLAEKLDGLMITGGADVDPSFYGQENTASSMDAEDIDISDFRLYRAFVRHHKPVLGICRGIQVINVCEGGTLIQDIPSWDSTKLNHVQRTYVPPIPRDQFCHRADFITGTVLHGIFGDSYGVNSFHHQCIDRPAEGFVISAYSEDGIIEGIEKEGVLAVQWHPERHVEDEKHKELARHFVRMCDKTVD